MDIEAFTLAFGLHLGLYVLIAIGAAIKKAAYIAVS